MEGVEGEREGEEWELGGVDLFQELNRLWGKLAQ